MDPSRQRVRFRNKEGWVGYWFNGVVGQLYPAVSIQIASDCDARVRVNFGKGQESGHWPFKLPPLTEADLGYTEPAADEEEDVSDAESEEGSE